MPTRFSVKEPVDNNGFKKGWNTRYITDFSKSVRMYVRGNEFTRQLDYFVDSIDKSKFDNISSFAEAFKTDVTMEAITKDALSTDKFEVSATTKDSIEIERDIKKPTFWKRFLNHWRTANAR